MAVKSGSVLVSAFLLLAVVDGRNPPCNLANITAVLRPGTTALREYVNYVYGPEEDEQRARLRDVDFSAKLHCCVNVLYPSLLPPQQRKCPWARDATGYGSIYRLQNFNLQPRNTVWIYRYETAGCPHKPTNQGRALPMPDEKIALHNVSTEWLEVTHGFTFHTAEKNGILWMYRAVGSGMWYKPGKTFETRTHERMLETAGNAGNWKVVLDWCRARGIETLAVTHRCEAWGPTWLAEFVDMPSLDRPAPERVTTADSAEAHTALFLQKTCRARFGRGYWPDISPCNCCAWGADRPTWCAAGDNFRVRYAPDAPFGNSSTINRNGSLPYIVPTSGTNGTTSAPLLEKAVSTARSGLRALQAGMADLLRFPKLLSGRNRTRPMPEHTVHFMHMMCAQPEPSR